MNKTGNKNVGENSALFNNLTNKDSNNIEFVPLKKIEGTNDAGYFPDGYPASEQHSQELKDPIPSISVNDNGSSNITDWKETPTAQKNGFGQKLYTALFGQQAQSTDNVNEDNPLFTALTKQQDEWRKQGLSEDAITGAGQGLNSGNKDIAKFIDDNNIRKPQTDEEIALAKEGKFNTYAPSITVSQTPPRGGFLRDLDAGMRENYNNEFSIDNLGNNLTPDGRKKGFAYRLGEGLGTLTRGMAGTTGDAWISGAVSPEAGLKRQSVRTNNGLYRNELLNNYVQSVQNDPRYNTLTNSEDAQIQEIIKNSSEYKNAKTNEEKNSIALQMYQTMVADKILSKQNEAIDIYKNNLANTKGFITDNAYEQLMKAQQLRDNAAYRKMYYDAQQANLRENMQFRKDQAKAEQEYKNLMLNFQKQKEASDRAYQNAQLGLGYARLNNDNYNKALDRAEKAKDRAAKILSKQENYGDIEKQINNFKATFKGLPSKAESYTFGNLRAMTGTQTTKEANFNAQRTLLFNQIARKLGGEKGVLSDQDMKRIELALPTLTDSYDQKIAKMRAVDDLLNIKKGGMPQTYTSGKYTVRVK